VDLASGVCEYRMVNKNPGWSPMGHAAFVFGCQRSGTTAFHECIGRHPLVESFPEEDVRAFYDWRLRDWLVKNSFVCQLNLDRRKDLMLCRYEDLLSNMAARDDVSTHLGVDVSFQLREMTAMATPYEISPGSGN
jgi:hypothetical protein